LTKSIDQNYVPVRVTEVLGSGTGTFSAVMGTHSFIRYFVTVTSLVMAVTNKFLFSSACNEVTEAIGDLKTD
jgi:hypothetical protein